MCRRLLADCLNRTRFPTLSRWQRPTRGLKSARMVAAQNEVSVDASACPYSNTRLREPRSNDFITPDERSSRILRPLGTDSPGELGSMLLLAAHSRSA